MKPTKEELEILRVYAQLSNTEDRYVWLRQDEKGTYIEYAFIEGTPHDNRCLSWYYSLQPNAIKRNTLAFGHTEEEALKEIEWRQTKITNKYVNNIFILTSFTCGHEESLETSLERNKKSWEEYHPGEPFIKEDYICRVGHPAPKCIRDKYCAHWTYEEPVKCACWELEPIDELPTRVTISMDTVMKLKDELLKKD